jgi:DNA primase
MSGVQNVVAPQGTALTSDHARILKRYVDEVVLCFDSDPAGQNAAVRSLDSLLASGLAIRVASVPSPHDPDSFIKASGPAAFAQLIEKAPGFFDFYIDRLCSLNDPATDRGRRAIVQGMAEALHKAGSEVLRDTYAQKTALRLGVAADAVRQEFTKLSRARFVQSDEPEESAASPAPRPTQHEWWLLRILLEDAGQLDWIAAHLELDWLPSPEAREIVSRRLQLGRNWPGAAAWLSQPENSRWQSLVSEILADSRPIPDAKSLVQGSPTREGIVKILRDKDIERRLADLNRRLAAAYEMQAAEDECLSEMQHLRRLKQQPLSPKSKEV